MCQVCCYEGGAMKQTSTGKWVHCVCANFMPELYWKDAGAMNTVLGLDKIDRARFKLRYV